MGTREPVVWNCLLCCSGWILSLIALQKNTAVAVMMILVSLSFTGVAVLGIIMLKKVSLDQTLGPEHPLEWLWQAQAHSSARRGALALSLSSIPDPLPVPPDGRQLPEGTGGVCCRGLLQPGCAQRGRQCRCRRRHQRLPSTLRQGPGSSSHVGSS